MKRRNDYMSGGATKRRKLIQARRGRAPMLVSPWSGPIRNRTATGSARVATLSRAPMATRGWTPNSVERKAFDTAPTTYQVNTTPNIFSICNPTVGADMNNRVGRKICLKSCYIRGTIVTEPSGSAGLVGASAAQVARLILLVDMQPNGSLPAIGDILANASVTGQLNLNSRDRFRVLWDKLYPFDPYIVNAVSGTSVATANRQIHIIKKFKIMNYEQTFNSGSTGTIADISTGSLVMCLLGTAATGALDINCVLSTRVRYTDL